MANVTAQEQLMLELINRARANPTAEAQRFGIDLNQGLAPGTITASFKQPLAMNQFLVTASRDHSQWMLNVDIFSHTGINGTTPGQRMATAGYAFTGSWSWGENISWTGTSAQTIDLTSAIIQQHESLFRSAGHRVNILGGDFKETGIGQVQGQFLANGTNWTASMVTQTFAYSGTGHFATGVVINDQNSNSFYDIGEGLAGVSVTLNGTNGTFTTTTFAAGGWEIKAPSGTYTVTFSGGALAGPIVKNITIGSSNVKVDAYLHEATAAGMGTAGPDNLVGTAGADNLRGLGGSDTLNGGSGNDSLDGGEGDDWIVYDAADTAANVNGGTGTDMLWILGGSAPTAFNLVARGFEGARHDITDTTNQSWSTIWDTYNTAWQRLTSDIRFDDGTRQIRNFDHLGNQSYSEFINQHLDVATPNAITKQFIAFDNGTKQERFFDYRNNQSYSEYTNDYLDVANASSVTRQVIFADAGTKQERFFDYLGNQNYVEYINDYADAARQGSVTRQVTFFDNGTRQERFFDYLNNQPAYSEYINFYNAAGQITRQVGFSNAGAQAWEYFY